jgi:NhaP-type Na+/H+ or K+/H+ antiporter
VSWIYCISKSSWCADTVVAVGVRGGVAIAVVVCIRSFGSDDCPIIQSPVFAAILLSLLLVGSAASVCELVVWLLGYQFGL